MKTILNCGYKDKYLDVVRDYGDLLGDGVVVGSPPRSMNLLSLCT